MLRKRQATKQNKDARAVAREIAKARRWRLWGKALEVGGDLSLFYGILREVTKGGGIGPIVLWLPLNFAGTRMSENARARRVMAIWQCIDSPNLAKEVAKTIKGKQMKRLMELLGEGEHLNQTDRKALKLFIVGSPCTTAQQNRAKRALEQLARKKGWVWIPEKQKFDTK